MPAPKTAAVLRMLSSACVNAWLPLLKTVVHRDSQSGAAWARLLQLSRPPRGSRPKTELGMQVVAIATLADLLEYLSAASAGTLAAHAGRVAAYRDRYGV